MIKKYSKLLIILAVAYYISQFSINNVFLAQSPKFNPFFTQNMLAKINGFRSKTTNLIAFRNINIYKFGNNSTNNSDNFSQSTNNQASVAFQKTNSLPQDIKEALTAPLQKVSQGVYAGEVNNTQVYEIRTDEIDYLEYIFNVNGKEIKIKVPKDQQPPSQELIEAFYK